MRIAAGTLQDEYVLSGEYQAFIGWVERLRAAGYSVRTFSPAGETLRAQAFERSRHGESLIAKGIDALKLISQAIRIAGQSDRVHLFLPTPNFLWIADRVRKRSGCPVVVTCFGEKPEGPMPQILDHLRTSARFYGVRYLSSWVMPSPAFRCERYLVGNRQIAGQLRAAGCPDDVITIAPPLLPEEAAPDAASLEVARQMEQTPTFLYMGHFLPNKGVDLVLNAFARVKQTSSRLVLAWSGIGDRVSVERRIQALGITGRVDLLSHPLNRTALFQRACALLLPYRSTIGQVSPPILLLEGMRTGVPMLISRLPGISEWVEDGKHAWLINPGDESDIARRLDELLTHPEAGEAMRQAQRDYFAQRVTRFDVTAAYSFNGTRNG